MTSLTMSAAPEQPVMGEAFDLHLQVSNAGPEAAADAGLYLGLPEEVEMTTFVADPSLDCHEVTYDDPYPGADPPSAGEGDGSTYPVYGGTSFECSAATLAPGSSSRVTLSLIRRAARPVFLYSSVYGSGSESNYEDNYAEIEIAPDADHAADVSVFMTTPHEVAIGATFDFAMTIENSGPTAAQDVVLFDPIPYGIDDISVTPSENCEIAEQNYGTEEDPYIYRELNCALGTLQPGETTEVRLTSTRTSAWEIYNDAWVTTTSYDTEYANDYAFASLPADPSVTSDRGTRVRRRRREMPLRRLFVQGADAVRSGRRNPPFDRERCDGVSYLLRRSLPRLRARLDPTRRGSLDVGDPATDARVGTLEWRVGLRIELRSQLGEQLRRAPHRSRQDARG
ncbi:MAG: DUF11 domain-containing protein [Actinobacteria bacterium]|nr:DUF11 domain-containing protein [Actinomycetota bacterium]